MSFQNYILRCLTLLAALACLTACSSPNEQSEQAVVADAGSDKGTNAGTDKSTAVAASMDSLVSTEWLNEHLDDRDLIIIDCTVMVEPDEETGFRIVNGRANYESGHIPSAGFADFLGDLSAGDDKQRFEVPSPEQFAATMSALGVSDNSRVVLYDANYSAWAARVWWMLRWIGFDNAALLDGGLRAWKAEGRPLSTEPETPMPGTLSINLRPELIADQDEVRAAIGDSSINIVDAMSAEHYEGQMTMYARPGHITGATNLPASLLLDESGRYRSYDELDMMTDIDRSERTITYCGGGIAASSDAFVLHRLGFKNVAVYTASLQEWAADPDNPMETGPASSTTDE